MKKKKKTRKPFKLVQLAHLKKVLPRKHWTFFFFNIPGCLIALVQKLWHYRQKPEML